MTLSESPYMISALYSTNQSSAMKVHSLLSPPEKVMSHRNIVLHRLLATGYNSRP